MTHTNRWFLGAVALAFAATPLMAQQSPPKTGDTGSSGSAAAAEAPPPETAPVTIQRMRLNDQRGIDVFEPPKWDNVPFKGFTVSFGAAFAQSFQNLSHTNTAAPNLVDGVNVNQLMNIGPGFDDSRANLYLNAQLAPGIRVALTTYLASRHHTDTWVKDGYLLIDQSPIHWLPLQFLMAFTTIKAGHFEIDYGDAHFRRSDNGQALYNPFIGNLLLDAFTTELGGEVLVRPGPFIGMIGVTGGEIHGEVKSPGKRSPAVYGKLGFDKQITPDVRVRLTGSLFSQAHAISNTLYHGDRAGSPFLYVMENTQASSSGQAWSGTINPGFSSEIHSFMINPFVKVGGVEFFGVFEQARGKAANESSLRTWTQYDGDLIYRFLENDKLYVAARYNTARGQLAGITNDVSVHRVELSGGWFVTPSLLLKGEYVDQQYSDFPTASIYNGGQFKGFMVQGVVSF